MAESECIDREIHVTEGALELAAAEVVAAWKAAEVGQSVESTDRLYFEDWNALGMVLTPKRYELLRHLRRIPADSVRALARALRAGCQADPRGRHRARRTWPRRAGPVRQAFCAVQRDLLNDPLRRLTSHKSCSPLLLIHQGRRAEKFDDTP